MKVNHLTFSLVFSKLIDRKHMEKYMVLYCIDVLLQQKMQQLLMKTCPAGNYNTNLVMVDKSGI